jgi:hypothetical protein
MLFGNDFTTRNYERIEDDNLCMQEFDCGICECKQNIADSIFLSKLYNKQQKK